MTAMFTSNPKISEFNELYLGTFINFASNSVVVIRIWLLYFDMHSTNYLKNKGWQMAINNKQNYQSWILTKPDTLGNGKFLLVIIIIIAIIETIIRNLLYLTISWHMALYFVIFTSFIKACIIGFIWYSINAMNLDYSYDSLGIKKELIALIIFYTVSVIVLVITAIICDSYADNEAIFGVFFLLYNYTNFFVCNCFIYITVILIKKLSKTGDYYGEYIKLSNTKSGRNHNHNHMPSKLALSPSISETEKGLNSWQSVVGTRMGYELFMNQLITEFSIENLLFITEVCMLVND